MTEEAFLAKMQREVVYREFLIMDNEVTKWEVE